MDERNIAIIKKAVRQKVVEYVGYVDDVPQLLRESSVVVLPTRYGEGLPLTILEALAAGRPVITTNAPGCRTSIEHGQEGWLVALQDPRGVLFWVGQIVNDPKMLDAPSKAARKLAEQRYNVIDVTQQMLSVLSR